MKHLKVLGLAVLAALGVMSFVGASTAPATTLYTNSAHTIDYPSGTTFHATLAPGTSPTLTDTSGNTIATCTESTVHFDTTATTGTWIPAHITALTWGGCSQTTDTVNAGSLEVMWTSGESGEVVSKGTNVTLNIFGVSCTYGTGEGTKLGNIQSGETPILIITAVIPKTGGGFLCPSTGIWHAVYHITTPHAVYITN